MNRILLIFASLVLVGAGCKTPDFPISNEPTQTDEYKKLKDLRRESLRDHMEDSELIFTMLGERSTTDFHTTKSPDLIR